jgi:putative addiction module component (TIGR02574 family)
MNNKVCDLLRLLQMLPEEVRGEIVHRLWHSIPNIKDELYSEYDQELFEDIQLGIEKSRPSPPFCLTAEDATLCEQALALPRGDRGTLTHLLWQWFPWVDGVFGFDDPEFIAELDRRMADMESGKSKSIPNEEVMRQMKEKYG